MALQKSSVPIYLIVAIAQNGVIGRDGDMPWRLSTDLKRFKAITIGQPVIMGRKTWNSLSKALPGRLNIVITRDRLFKADGASIVHSLDDALKLATDHLAQSSTQAIFIIGGGEIFKQAMPIVDKMFITEIQATIEGDTFFPQVDLENWVLTTEDHVPSGEKDSHATRFVVYERCDGNKI